MSNQCGHCHRRNPIYTLVWQPFISACVGIGPDDGRVEWLHRVFLDHPLFGLHWASWQEPFDEDTAVALRAERTSRACRRFGVELELAGAGAHWEGEDDLVVAVVTDPSKWRDEVLGAILPYVRAPGSRARYSNTDFIQFSEYLELLRLFDRTWRDPPDARRSRRQAIAASAHGEFSSWHNLLDGTFDPAQSEAREELLSAGFGEA